MTMTVNTQRRNLIADFVETVRSDDHFVRYYARLASNDPIIRTRKAGQIRTKAHTADAFALDCIGNVAVLWSDGRRQQLIGDAEIREAKLFR
jgi:hypothetical protein